MARAGLEPLPPPDHRSHRPAHLPADRGLSLRRPLLKATAIGALLAGAAWACPGLLGPEFRHALATAELSDVLLAGILGLFLINALRTLRIQGLLQRAAPALSPPTFRALFAITLKTRALNVFLPARTGEAYRIVSVHGLTGHPRK